jgi:hypothetical protein
MTQFIRVAGIIINVDDISAIVPKEREFKWERHLLDKARAFNDLVLEEKMALLSDLSAQFAERGGATWPCFHVWLRSDPAVPVELPGTCEKELLEQLWRAVGNRAPIVTAPNEA